LELIGRIDLGGRIIEAFDMLKKLSVLSVMLFLTSCKQGEKSVDQVDFEAQAEELEALQTELVEVRARAKEAKAKPPEVPVAELQEKLDTAKGELAKLNEKFAELEKSHDEVVKKLEDYQEKYPLR